MTWEDGSENIVSLSDPVNRLKVFVPLREGDLFRKVGVADYGWAIRWTDEIDFSADSVWRLAQEQAGQAMSAKDFRDWRARNGLSQQGAAEALGLSRRTIAYYESGEKPIPKTVWLACRGLEAEKKLAAHANPPTPVTAVGFPYIQST